MKEKFIIILSSLVILGISGCAQNKPGNFVPTTSTSTTFSIPTTTNMPVTAIDKNDVTTWPRFEFKELGLSIQLPFEKDDFQIIYNECRNGKFYTKLDNSLDFKQNTEDSCIDSKTNYFSYFASFKKGNYAAITSLAGQAAIEGEGGLITDNKGNPIIKQIGNPIIKIGSGKNAIYKLHNSEYEQDEILHPLTITVVQGVEFITYNYLEDIAKYHHRVDYTPQELLKVPYKTTVFNVPHNTQFETVSIRFSENDLNQDQLIEALKTIKFFN